MEGDAGTDERRGRGRGCHAMKSRYLVVTLGHVELALPLSNVRGIRAGGPGLAADRPSGWGAGEGGAGMPTIDLALALRLPRAHDAGAGPLVIVEHGGRRAGLAVDRAVEVVAAEPAPPAEWPHAAARPAAAFVVECVRQGDRVFSVVDVAALLDSGPRGRG